MDTAILKQIKTVLQSFPEYWEGEMLSKNKVIEDLRNYKVELIQALLANDSIRKTYSIETELGFVLL